MQYTYRELQSLLKDARSHGFHCEYPLNSKKEALVEMYEDYCAWKTYNQYESETRQEQPKDEMPSWEEVIDQANKSFVHIYTWSYRKIQLWVRCLRDKHWFAIHYPLNSTKEELMRELRRCFDIINGNERKRQERERQRQEEWKDFFSSFKKETPSRSYLINDVNIFEVDVKSIGWLQPAQSIFGTEANEIKKTWRKLAVQHHPDHGGDKEIFQQLNNIHERLTRYLSA